MNNRKFIAAILSVAALSASAHAGSQYQDNDNNSQLADNDGRQSYNDNGGRQTYADNDSLKYENKLQGVTVKSSATRRMAGAITGTVIGRDELFKAACCNLGESFTTNPSVDVSYSDAATGAKQIKLLGLSGTYVQMLTENMPNYRNTSTPYSMGYVPGPWMKAIQVSKGCASVKNGYESITGQINIDYLKPEDEPKTEINLFGDTDSRIETNVTSNFHLNKRLSTVVLAHYEDQFKNHDENNDGFFDKPAVRQGHLDNRWVYLGDRYIFHGGISALLEKRKGGQMHGNDSETDAFPDRYRIDLSTNRYEGYMKHALVLDKERGASIALMTSASMHELDATYGLKDYDVNEKNMYASLIYESNFTPMHNLSAGLSVNYDYLGQRLHDYTSTAYALQRITERETVPGAYAQYTFNLNHKLTAMAGLRIDHSSVFGTFVTPRFNVKYMPADFLTVRLSAGKGYRTVHALAENNNLLASGRSLVVDPVSQERAWNYGATTAWNFHVFGRLLKLNLEYFYTRFSNQSVVDYDSDPGRILIGNLHGKSYSHTLQADATYEPLKGLSVTAAYRLNDVKSTYGGVLREKPLQSKYKALLALSYKTPLELWQFDATLQLNGGGRMPQPYTMADGTQSWNTRFHAYEQLTLQVTRWFRHFSVYAGGENLTNFRQKHPIVDAGNPWGKDFDPTMVWGPVLGRMFYAGIRVTL